MKKSHQKAVDELSNKVRYFYEEDIPFRIYHGSTNSTRVLSFDKNKMIDTSKLNKVLSIDAKNRKIVVEPNISMDKLIKSTLKKGLIPPVVMEFPGITVAGGAQGGAGESSSYKYGTFNRIINWYDILLGNGSIVRASRNENQGLYWGTAGSYGTLGLITAAEIQLIPAKMYVQLEYIPVNSFYDAIETIDLEIAKRPDYIDGIMYSKNQGVIMLGNFTDNSDAPVRKFSRAHDEWFYLHAKKMIISDKRKTEKVPIKDYLFRYNRGGFWMGEFSFNRLKTPFNRFTRWSLNPLMNTRKMYAALQASGVSQECIIQDISVPVENTVKFLKYIDKDFGIYPIWLCPLLKDDKSPLLPNYLDTKLAINIGIWGKNDSKYSDILKANRQLEDEVYKHKGKKVLYAQSFYDEKLFWKIYGGKDWYRILRDKYNATKLPTIFDKVIVTKQYEISALKGVLFAVLGLSGIRKK